jgi:hypothetical protein
LNWLVSGVRWMTCRWPRKLIAEGTLSHARSRLGWEVFRRIFHNLVAAQGELPRDFHGLTSAALDGSTMTMPDTQENRERLGIPTGGRGAGGYPQLRAVALLVLAARRVIDIVYGAYKGKGTGERSLMITLIERLPYKRILYLMDAGLYSFNLLIILKKKSTISWPS